MGANWHKISLFFFLIVAVIGSLLRALHLTSLPFAFDHLVHAHSHTAFQGWVYTMIMLILMWLFLTPEEIKKGKFVLQFKISIAVVLGILISFSLQGYGLYSILFSSLFQLLNYWFIFSFFKHANSVNRRNISYRFVRNGLWLGLLSTLAPWGIGIVSAKGMKGSEAYDAFIYFFLHFQYNGWFLFVALGLLYKLLEQKNIRFSIKYAERFYYLFSIAVVPALSLSYIGMSFKSYILIPAYLSAVLQLLAILCFYLCIKSIITHFLQSKDIWFKLYFLSFIVSFLLKIVLQFISILPVFEELAFGNRNLILAYLHLSFIGVISFLLIAILLELKCLSNHLLNRIGHSLFFSGFILTELLLLSQAFEIFVNHNLLLAGSLAMAFGILFLLLSPAPEKMSR